MQNSSAEKFLTTQFLAHLPECVQSQIPRHLPLRSVVCRSDVLQMQSYEVPKEKFIVPSPLKLTLVSSSLEITKDGMDHAASGGVATENVGKH
jgi:hypothetical protein